MQRADSLEKTLMLGNIESRRRKGATENEMVGWHHQLNGHEFEQTLEISEGQGSLVCCSPWGLKESDMTELLNSTETFQNISAESSKIHRDTHTCTHPYLACVPCQLDY